MQDFMFSKQCYHDSNSTTDLLMEPAASSFSICAVHEDTNLFPILLQKNFL
jgi:hypothetical protein